ncbi:MAG: hypothetical protein J1E34_07870 [Oscillospiraceae bacterium]|nr:hypothetical protein [Oscillospiraceae bacterium]
MKKLISVFLSSVLLFFTAPLVFASEASIEETIQFDDGSFIEIRVEDKKNNEIKEDAKSVLSRFMQMIKKILYFFTGTKTAAKTKYVNYYDKNGTLLWSVFLTAEFTYSKTRVNCEKASVSFEIFDSDWKMTSAQASKNGDTATATFSVRQFKLGVPLKSIERIITLVCSEDGNIC